MTDLTLTKTRLYSGIWEGHLAHAAGADSAPPTIAAYHLEAELPDVAVEPISDAPGHWIVKVPVPASILSDGVQTVTITEPSSGDTLASFSLVAGDPLDEDLRAEISLLRAELDMLKRAFRRHCLETA